MQFLVIKALDPDPDPDPETYPDSLEILDPDSDPVPDSEILKTAKKHGLFNFFLYIYHSFVIMHKLKRYLPEPVFCLLKPVLGGAAPARHESCVAARPVPRQAHSRHTISCQAPAHSLVVQSTWYTNCRSQSGD